MAGEVKQVNFATGVTPSAPTTAFQTYELEDTTGDWDGSTDTKTYDVSATITDARKMIWVFQDTTANNRRQLQGADIDFPTATQVRVTFGLNIAAGSYWLVGVGAG